MSDLCLYGVYSCCERFLSYKQHQMELQISLHIQDIVKWSTIPPAPHSPEHTDILDISLGYDLSFQYFSPFLLFERLQLLVHINKPCDLK